MQAATEDLEGIAADLLGETGCDDPPVCALELAQCCGLAVIHGTGAGAALVGDIILVPSKTRAVRRQGLIAHELGHWALARAGEPDSEEGARFLAGALMLPRRPFERDLAATSWDLRLLRARHLNASAEMIARRIVTLRDACCTIVDNGRVKARVVSPWLPERFRRLSTFERGLAALALETGETQRPDQLVWAVPVFDGQWRRVVVIAEAEQLSLRI